MWNVLKYDFYWIFYFVIADGMAVQILEQSLETKVVTNEEMLVNT